MKSCIMERSTDTRLDLQCLPGHILLEDNYFATVPLIAIQPARTQGRENEEELHTLFEEAISERVKQVSKQFRHPSINTSFQTTQNTGNARTLQIHLARAGHFWKTWRQTISLICLGLCLLSLGFDLMGLLVLMH